MQNPMFERDILYQTQNPLEPGSVRITVYSPEDTGGLTVVVKAKTDHNPIDYLQDIVSILQIDIFDRIRINIKENGVFYFVPINKKSALKIKFLPDGNNNVEEITDLEIIESI